jgi:hypothetical protein
MMTINISRGAGSPVFQPAAADGAFWETEVNAPGRFFCLLRDDPALEIGEGNAISVRFSGKEIFSGYIFTRRYDNGGTVGVTAYDQIRYLKYRDTAVYDGITASGLLRRFAAAHPSLRLGTVEDTGIRLEPRAEDAKPLLDLMRNALRETQAAGGGRFVLSDEFGRLCLRRAGEPRSGLIIGAGGSVSSVCSYSIDADTYNHIRLICDDPRRGRTVTFRNDPKTEAEWGKLQYTERITGEVNANMRAGELLSQHNRVRRELFCGGVPGDPAVRAGVGVTVVPELAGGAGERCVVERARHVWKNGGYMMDLEVS